MGNHSIGEFEKYYQSAILPQLKELETKRKEVLQKTIFLILIVGSVFILLLLIAVFMAGMFSPFLISAAILSVVVYIIIDRLTLYKYRKQFILEFKMEVIKKLIDFLSPGLSYDPDRYIPASTFRSSQIFLDRIDRYKGDDLVWGNVGGTALEFSELTVQKEEKRHTSKGTQTQIVTIFKGLFFVADFNKEFKGSYVLLPDLAQKFLGHLGQKLQSIFSLRGELIKLEDPEFEKRFRVYGTDQIEARYILSTSLMKRMVDFWDKANANRNQIVDVKFIPRLRFLNNFMDNRMVYVSFVASKMYMGIAYRKNLFEPKITRSLIDYQKILEYYEDLDLALGIVHDLNLNTRIWSKT
ncbi:DUF3137 domain-containing protein [bacterium]|nr:DUF3137 domain-containing protein [bacterium]